MQTLSHHDEQRITDSAIKVARLVDEGSEPNEAAARVAKEASLTPNFIRLMSVGYNTGLVNHQRETATGGLLDKLADVPLIDADQVILSVYPSGQSELKKSAMAQSAAVYDEDIYSEVLVPEVSLESDLVKLASALQEAETVPQPAVTSVFQKHLERSAKAAEYQSQLDELRIQYLRLEESEFPAALTRLWQGVESSPNYDTDSIKLACETFLSPEDAAISRAVIQSIPETYYKGQIKAASDLAADWDKEPLSNVKAVIDLVKRSSDLRVQMKVAEFYLTEADPLSFVPVNKHRVQSKKTAADFDILEDSLDKMAFLAPLAGAAISAVGSGGSDRLDSLTPMYDDNLKSELNNIRAHSMLSGLIANDDVIGTYDPEEVYQAYNEMSPMYPTIVHNPGFMRPLLRKRLAQGSLDPMEMIELAKVETTLQKAREQHAATSDRD